MSQLNTDIPFPPAPACAPWCDGTTAEVKNGWTHISVGGVLKECVRDWEPVAFAIDEGSDEPHIKVSLYRWVQLGWPTELIDGGPRWNDPAGLCIKPPSPTMIRINDWDELTPDDAVRLAHQLLEAAERAR